MLKAALMGEQGGTDNEPVDPEAKGDLLKCCKLFAHCLLLKVNNLSSKRSQSSMKSPWKGEAKCWGLITKRQTSTILHSVPMDSAQRTPEPCWQGSHASRKPIVTASCRRSQDFILLLSLFRYTFSKCISTVKLFAVPFGSMSTEVRFQPPPTEQYEFNKRG